MGIVDDGSPPLQGSCVNQVSSLQPLMEKNGLCCESGQPCEKKGGSTGPPQRCSAKCAKVWNPFYGKCSETLLRVFDRDKRKKAKIVAFDVKCRRAAGGN